MNENSGACLSDVLENISDSTFKQFAEMKDIFDEVDFSNVFSHLKDVIRTPEKLKQHEEKLEDHPPVSDVCLLHIYLYYDVCCSQIQSWYCKIGW